MAGLRVRKGYESQRKLAHVSGISHATISRIEKDLQSPQPSTLKILSKYLATPYEELMKEAGYLDDDFKQTTA